MNVQAELFPPRRRARVPDLGSPPLKAPGYRKGGPQTSKDAATVAMGSAKEQRLLILGAVRQARAHGLNASECDEAQDWPTGTTGRRMGEMADAPAPEVYRVAGLERPTASGNWGQVYQSAESRGAHCGCTDCAAGRAYVAAREAKAAQRRQRSEARWDAAAAVTG